MKLSKRLQTIESLVTHHYNHIWDCCCDHGFLGMSLLSRPVTAHLHFVDIVAPLMAQLQSRLERYLPAEAGYPWTTHCQHVGALPLSEYPGSHLVIIAGVGGDLMSDLVDEICRTHPDMAIEFLLCPVHHTYTLRQQLQRWGAQCISEHLIEENRRYYEILHIVVGAPSPRFPLVSTVGEQIWQPNTGAALIRQRYHARLLAHYARMQQSAPEKVGPILAAYQAIRPAV